MVQQVAINALVAGAQYALLGLGFALIYRTVRFFHFAHGLVFTVGAYATFLFNAWLRFTLLPSILLGVTVGALLGLLMEVGVFLPLRRNRASPVVMLLASLGIYLGESRRDDYEGAHPPSRAVIDHVQNGSAGNGQDGQVHGFGQVAH